MTELILGIDAGGSKTHAWLASNDADRPIVIGKGKAGAGNPLSNGWNDSLDNIATAIKSAFSDAGEKQKSIRSLCLSVAGGDRESVRTRFLDWLERERVASNIQVTNDALPLLFAGCPDGVGIAVIAGTGSIVYGRGTTERTVRCGGWGHLIGDEGSGYWIAIQALKAITDAEDGRSEPTALTPSFLQAADVSEVTELIGKVYSAETTKKEIANWAALVFSCRERGDPRARQIVKDAATQIALQVQSVVRRFDLGPPFPMAFAGGVATSQPEFAELIVGECNMLQIAIAAAKEVKFPAWGAVLMAQRNS